MRRVWVVVVLHLVPLAACSVAEVVFKSGAEPLPDATAPPLVDAAPVDAPAAPTLLRCTGLAKTCGANGTDSCCASPIVPGGTYYRSYDVAGDADSWNQSSPATVSTFRLDKYEVTVGRFRAFVNAGQGTQASPPASGAGVHAAISGSGWDSAWNASLPADQAALIAAVKCDTTLQTWTDSSDTNETRPMTCITWYEAMAFCLWDEGYLPTEAEWNYAATGGSEQRAYPWSNPASSVEIDSTRANHQSSAAANVGSKALGDGRWEQSDLAGNVWEWNLDLHFPYAIPCTDCAQVGSGTDRAIRGGGFSHDAVALRASHREYIIPASRSSNIGVRCARTP